MLSHYAAPPIRVKYLLQICGHLRFGERRLVLQESVTLTQHRNSIRAKRKKCKVLYPVSLFSKVLELRDTYGIAANKLIGNVQFVIKNS